MDRPGKFSFDLGHVMILALAGWFIFNLIQTLRYVVADYSQIPVMDYWRVVQLWANPQAVRWLNLWEQHNEHRIVFPELVYIADMFWLRGRMYLPIAFSGVCYLGVWLVLVWAAYVTEPLKWPTREIGLLLAGLVLVWKGCSTVIATPFQLQFTLLQLASALGFLFLSKLADTGRFRYLVGVVTAGLICTYSSANGMLDWMVLVCGATFLKLRIRQVLILSAAGAVSIGLFFVHYRFLPSLISTNIKHPLQCAAFLCSYLSMPFGGYGTREFGFKVGAANLLLMAFCLVVAVRQRLLRSRLLVVVFGLYLFTLMSATLTTLGRMDLNDYLFAQAKPWRYVTMPTATWALLAIAAVCIAGRVGSRNWSMVMASLLAFLFYAGFRRASDWVETTRLDSANAQVTATMLRNGVFDPDQVRTIFPDAEFVRVYSKVLLDARKSIYAHGGDKWVGGNLLSLPQNAIPVEGKMTRMIPVPGGLEIFGWAEVKSLEGDHEILFVDAHNRIAGFGRRPAAGLPANLSAWDTPNLLAFVGYVSLATPITKLSAYVRTFHGKVVQPVDQQLEVPGFTRLETKLDRAPVPGVAWTGDGSWTQGGYTVDPENGVAPKPPIYASWSGSDGKTGEIGASFKTPGDGCFVLPVLHGIGTYGQSVQISDSATKQEIAALHFLDGRAIWQRWLIHIPAITKNISITAADRGTGPNQWLAVATPEVCPAAQ